VGDFALRDPWSCYWPFVLPSLPVGEPLLPKRLILNTELPLAGLSLFSPLGYSRDGVLVKICLGSSNDPYLAVPDAIVMSEVLSFGELCLDRAEFLLAGVNSGKFKLFMCFGEIFTLIKDGRSEPAPSLLFFFSSFIFSSYCFRALLSALRL